MTPDDPRAASRPDHDHDVAWDVRIPVRDGLELSANIWRPRPRADAPGARFPAILEMIPYGKDNWRRNWDTAFGEWLAARGFALCRLDVRGTGSSPGVALDEYTEAETLDGFDTVEWLAAQPWCNGNVGMWGISYGGFTSIQVAKLRPPHLRAIAPMYATDDRYRDDVHVRGGCITASEKSQYAVSQLGMNAMPPRPSFRGAGWREEWLARLEQTPPWLLSWVREQLDGPYWRRGSLAPDYEALECAVFQIAGWSDSYVDPAFRIQERCVNAARRTLVGNWVHSFPDDAYPGPNLDWMHEFVRFFDRYLKDVDNGWEDEPALTWFEREWATPEPFPREWPGDGGRPTPSRFRARRPIELFLGGPAGVLAASVADDGSRSRRIAHRGDGGDGGVPVLGRRLAAERARSRPAPGRAARGDVHHGSARRPALGHRQPEVVLHLSASMPVATCVVRLSEVSPDGRVVPRRHGRPQPHPSPLGRGAGADARRPAADPEEVRIPLRSTGYRFTPGYRIRLTVLTGYWPALWPSPLPGELRVHRGHDAVAAGAAGRAGRGRADGDGYGGDPAGPRRREPRVG